MLQSLNDWTPSLDQSKSVDIVYVDFSKAFDRVPHDKLLYKLHVVGIHPRIIAWIRSFLSKRSFAVRINSEFSKLRPVTCGVPQGGVLSPLLFNLYTYDLAPLLLSTGIKCTAFADDLKIYHSFSDHAETQRMCLALRKLSLWSSMWGLPLSPEKTKVLHLGPKNPSIQYAIDDMCIQEVSEIRDLGFWVTKDLSFDRHCEVISKKATRVLFNLLRGLSTRKASTLVQAYKSYVRPILEYGTSIFNPHKCSMVHKLEKVQNTFTRRLMTRVMGFVYDQIPSSRERNANFNLQSLAYRRRKFDLILFHKIFTGHCKLRPSLFYTCRPSLTRGNAVKYHVLRAKHNVRYHFFANRAGGEYFRLHNINPFPIQLKSFVKALDTYLSRQIGA